MIRDLPSKNTYRCALSIRAKVDASAAIRSNFAAAFRLSACVSDG